MNNLFGNVEKFTHKKIIIALAVVTVLALIVETALMTAFNINTCSDTMELMVGQVSAILESNDQEEQDLLDSLKSEYKVRAKAVAHFFKYNHGAEYDVDQLKELADLMDIDEIHIFDSTGTIVRGTNPEYYGMTFNSGEQISYFKPMLYDKNLSMCQDITPNTAENKEIMYAMTWNEDKTEIIQVGIQPKRLIDKLKSNDVSEVVSNMPNYSGYNIYVVNAESGKIEGATETDTVGNSLESLNLDLSEDDFEASAFKIIVAGGFRQYVKCQLSGDYEIIITHSTRYDIPHYLMVEFIELIYLIVAAIIIYLAVTRLVISIRERENQLSILISMADVYYSMHFVNLVTNTLREYKAQYEVKEIANHEDGADQVMIDTMKKVVKEDYLNAVLKFTDIKSLPERMKGKKIISGEFVGKRIGWFRASFIMLKADAEGRPVEIMFTTRSIDEDKKKEQMLIERTRTDGLTQLLNRRAYESEMNSGDTVYEDLIYMALDVNGLKKVNDTQGHAAGDELIIGAASCISRVFGKYGNVFRTGGDEFVVIIHADREKFEEIKKEFESEAAGWTGKLNDSLSISYGYVFSDEIQVPDIKSMAISADKRMYENKYAYYKREGIDRRTV